jgi:16S rRNA U1498 N3-methylase RsmE
VEAGFTAVSLGRHVLRIETAAIAVAAVVAATRRPPTLPDR